jgi:Purple acid Phosphatase, N-terminal domain/Calcineurin-like phosphoesterase
MQHTRWFLAAAALLALTLTGTSSSAAPGQIHLSWSGDTATTMAVTWRSTDKTGQVQYGPSSYGKTVVAASKAFYGNYLHQAQITGLTPGTAYHYRCGASGNWSTDYTFSTAPPAGASYRFVALGDSRSDDAARKQVRLEVQKRKPAFSIHTGDFVSNGKTQSQWDTWFTTMQPLLVSSPLLGALGNHEGLASNYYDQFLFPTHGGAGSVEGEAYYSFNYASSHIIALSTEHAPAVGDPQYVWLKKDLAAAAADPKIKWVVAFAHRPPYSSGSHGNDSNVQQAWLHLFESFGVDVTFWGHDHTYERHKPLFQGKPTASGGVLYIVTGGAGAPLYTLGGSSLSAYFKKIHHFMELNVSGDQMKIDARLLDGTIMDSLTLTKKGPKPTWITDGAPDPKAKLLGSKPGGELHNLRAGFDGRYLYVATQGKPAALDHFLFLALNKPSAATRSAPWAKAGKVWRSDSILAMESSSGWSSWQRTGQVTMIPYGAVWKYHDQGQDLGSAWRAAGYADASWASGPAQLGYGDGDEKTKLLNANPNHPSVYLRRSFTLGKAITASDLKVIHDDGAAVWINDVLVFSKYATDTSFKAWADQSSSDNQLSTTTVIAKPGGGPFKVGQNVVAVMVKQADASSSDVSFDLELVEPKGADATGARAANPAGQLMEGFIDLKARFGTVPKRVYLAAAAYGTKNGGALVESLPAGNGDGDLGAGEWYELTLIPDPPPPPDAGPLADATAAGDATAPQGDGAAPQKPDSGPGSNLDGESGCSCEVSRSDPDGLPTLLLLLLLAGCVLVSRRRL